MNRVLQRLAVLLLLAFGAGCGREAPEASLRPVTLPSLEGLPEAAQTQIAQQHARTQASGNGEAYGTLGQVLFTYDFLEPAEAAFLNAEALLPEDPRWPYYLGMLYRQQGAFAEAAARFERVAEDAPDDVLARLRLAESYLELGRTADARALLDEVVSTDPDRVFARFLLGQIAYEDGAYREAADHYEAVLARQPEATQVHAPLALAYRALGDAARSQGHLEQRGNGLVRLSDPRVQALDAFKQSTGATAQTQGEALLNAGRYAEAVAVLERAAGQEGAGASTFLNLGVARAYAGDQDGAVVAFEEALRLDPTKSNAHFNLGAIYAARGQTERAEAAFRAAATHDPRSGRAHLELAELLRRSRRCAEAVPHFEQALAILPGDVGARQHLALCYLRTGRAADARALLEDGLAALPDHVGFADALARVLAAAPDAAVRDGARALTLAERTTATRRRPETLETLAMAYAELGRYAAAVDVQEEAIRRAEATGHAAYLDHLRAALRDYRQQTPSRTPWPPFMYEM